MAVQEGITSKGPQLSKSLLLLPLVSSMNTERNADKRQHGAISVGVLAVRQQLQLCRCCCRRRPVKANAQAAFLHFPWRCLFGIGCQQ